jgi:hypothetical protein
MRDTIEKYLGDDALDRFAAKRAEIQEEYEQQLEVLGIEDDIEAIKEKL